MPFASIPVYDQIRRESGDPALCYAIVASQLIDADRFSQNPAALEKLSSPLSIALNYKMSLAENPGRYGTTNELLEGEPSERVARLLGMGTVTGAIIWNQGLQVCDQRWLQSFSALIANRNSIRRSPKYLLSSQSGSMTHFLTALTKFATKTNPDSETTEFFRSRFRSVGIDESKFRQSLSRETKDPLLTAKGFLEALCANHSVEVPKSRPSRVLGFDDPSYEKELWNLAIALRQPGLTSETTLKLRQTFNSKFDPATKAKRLAEKTDELLAGAKPVPVAIEYCVRALAGEDPDCIPTHGSVVIGRKWNHQSKACEYLVRNSYGRDCTLPSGGKYTVPCEDGSLWVERDRLFKATMGINWIAPH